MTSIDKGKAQPPSQTEVLATLCIALLLAFGLWLKFKLMAWLGLTLSPLVWIGIAALLTWLLLLPVARRLGTVAVARFDGEALSADPEIALPAVPPTPAMLAQVAPLRAWCFEGLGEGRSPLLRPSQAPHIPRPLALAMWQAPAGLARAQAAQHLARDLDGGFLLQAAPSRAAGLALRLRVKLHDLMWWRGRREDDPWDSGYPVRGPEGLAALARFRPRRPTLMVMDGWPLEIIAPALQALADAAPYWRQPVRVLWLAEHGPLAHLNLDAAWGEATLFSLES